jgi:hypothetical protein
VGRIWRGADHWELPFGDGGQGAAAVRISP